MLPLTPAELAKPDTVTDADAKAYYEQHKNSYGTPERRELQQMILPRTAKRRPPRARSIAKGLSFADLAKERGLKPTDTDLGIVSKSRSHRSGDRRGRLRAQARRSERADQGRSSAPCC